MNHADKDGMVKGHIPTEAWKPSHEEFDYPKSFVTWIDSINSGWQNKEVFKPFNLYCKQAKLWLEDKSDIIDFDNEEDQYDWLVEEIQRCKDNTLYFCNKYGFIKEDKSTGGMLKYSAWEAQEVLLFLFDCGYSMMIGKARQIGFTTTMCLAGMKRVNLNKSYFIKFVTHSESKGIEIFRDKVKWTYTKIPEYIAQDVRNWTDKVMSFDKKGQKKGRDEGGASRFQVDSPQIDAINGGSPSAVFVDEIGLFDIFGEMMREGRPALFKYNPETGKMTMQQQFMAWGTGGEMDKGGSVFESEFKMCMKQWKEGNYEYGIIPLFFNAYARRGVDDKHINNERKAYLALEGTKKGEVAKVQFHQHYPITIDDMFLRKSRTLVPIHTCNQRLADIYGKEVPIEYGFFEPILDMSQPTPDLLTSHRIVGASWMPTKGREDIQTSAVIVHHPPQGEVWKNRWYQGTDPINSETGHSMMSSAVWDAYTNSVSSVVFHRDRKFKQTYLQVLLQSLYYDQQKRGGIKELIENNIGDMHLDFQEIHGFRNKFTAMAQLPEYFQTHSGKWFGISNKANTGPRIIAKTEEMVDTYANSIDIPWIWEQLKTFVEKDLKSSNSHRQTRYQAADTRYDYDDAIFSITFAYINAQSHSRYEPENVKTMSGKNKVITRYVQSKETNYRMKLARVDKDTGKILKIIN
tara:strand:+ start:327 stop:2390 length:2064 start_codon:yes stop_codon:yes gene_type:complete